MSVTPRIKFCILAAALSALPYACHALSMGRLHLFSGLGEPLNGKIELEAIQPDEAESMEVALASPEAYMAANLNYPSTLLGLKLVLDKQSDGKQIIRISSSKAVDEPIVELLVELRSSAGKLIRDYSILLDPPNYNQHALETKKASINPIKPTSPEATPPESENPTDKASQLEVESPITSSVASNDLTSSRKYKVKPGDTLIQLARQNRVSGLSLDQVMVGLFHANPDAFSRHNINGLASGKIITIPSKKQFRPISKNAAAAEIRLQNKYWQTHRRQLGEAVAKSVAVTSKAVNKASGKMATKAGDPPASVVSGKDILKLSPVNQKQTRTLSASSEDASTHKKSLVEHNQRIAELEKNIKKMEALTALESKNQSASQNKAASVAPSAIPKIAIVSPLGPNTASQAGVASVGPLKVASSSQAKKGTAKTGESALNELKMKHVQPASSLEHTSFFGRLSHHALSVGLGLIVLAVLVGSWIFTRRREYLYDKSNNKFATGFQGEDGGPEYDDADAESIEAAYRPSSSARANSSKAESATASVNKEKRPSASSKPGLTTTHKQEVLPLRENEGIDLDDSNQAKIALARAYMDMGDVQKAHEILSKMVNAKGASES